MVTLFIDKGKVTVPTGTTVLEAAQAAGSYIPTLCYHPDLSTFGGCRVCMVDVNGKFVEACRTPVEGGAVVVTDSPALMDLRRSLVEMVLINHNPDCQTCVRNNNCVLQEVTAYAGITKERMARLRRDTSKIPTDTTNPFFDFDYTRCVLCGICVRTCREINGSAAIDFANRSNATRISPLGGWPATESICESCGECMERCPTGALARKNNQVPAREVKTICPYCGTGCGVYLGVRGNKIVSTRGDRENPVNKGQLCIKGRFGYDFVGHPDRLKTPLIKKDGKFVEASWDEALTLIVDKIKEAQGRYGPEALGGLSSTRIANEDNYLFQKLLRSLGTNSIDCSARL